MRVGRVLGLAMVLAAVACRQFFVRVWVPASLQLGCVTGTIFGVIICEKVDYTVLSWFSFGEVLLKVYGTRPLPEVEIYHTRE